MILSKNQIHALLLFKKLRDYPAFLEDSLHYMLLLPADLPGTGLCACAPPSVFSCCYCTPLRLPQVGEDGMGDIQILEAQSLQVTSCSNSHFLTHLHGTTCGMCAQNFTFVAVSAG